MNVHGPILGLMVHAKITSPDMNQLTSEIATLAARLVVEDGLEYGAAKRRAVKQLGLPARTALPGNDELDSEVHDYISIFCGDTQPGELLALRRHALMWMERLTDFRPHLGGAVWRGTATRLSDIHLQLFCDDAKMAEMALINWRVKYEARTVPGFKGLSVDCLSVHSQCPGLNEEVGVHLAIYDFDDLRGALRTDARGLPRRGTQDAVRRLLLDSAHNERLHAAP